MLSQEVESTDPLLDVEDKLVLLPASGSEKVAASDGIQESPVPFGFRLAVRPARGGKHGKTYTTVKITEDTERSDDGKVYTVPDTVEREQETD